ncbi:MAG: hypothetical protein PHI06_06150 [Desulfobulbaceae bacterium]|nr:hypothetical protein [Desulfobulbaceae bacterium]
MTMGKTYLHTDRCPESLTILAFSVNLKRIICTLFEGGMGRSIITLAALYFCYEDLSAPLDSYGSFFVRSWTVPFY